MVTQIFILDLKLQEVMMVQRLGQIHLKTNGKSMQHLHKRVIDLNKHNMILYKEHIMISQ